MKLRLTALALGLGLSLVNGAAADPTRIIEGARIRLGDLAATVNSELADVDLGPAPPAGGSRLFARDELLNTLRSQGLDLTQVRLPQSIRVTSAGRRFTPKDLRALVEPRVRAALPAGVSLNDLRVSRALLASPRLAVGHVRVPKLVRREGTLTVTASVDLTHEGSVVARLPVTLELLLSQEAAQPLVRKGSRVDLMIQRGQARISASGVALDDAELGETRSFRVSSTSKVLRARIESATLAVVVTP